MRMYAYRSLLYDFSTLIYTSPDSDFQSFEAGKGPLPYLERRDKNEKPLYSWRFAEYLTWPVPLPHNLPWTAEEYQSSRDYSIHLFCHEGETDTLVFAMGGPDTAFDRTNPLPAKSLPHNLILFADVFESNTHWMQPGDFNVETLPEKINVPGGLGSKYYSGFFVGFVDGQIWWLSDDVPVKLLLEFCTITGAEKSTRTLLEPYCRYKYQANKEYLMWLE